MAQEIREAFFYNDDIDAAVYGNGKTSFTVHIYNYETDERSKRRFCQKNAKVRAFAYAKEQVK